MFWKVWFINTTLSEQMGKFEMGDRHLLSLLVIALAKIIFAKLIIKVKYQIILS